MNNELSKIINSLCKKYSNRLTKDEIKEILNIDNITADSPFSTGKRLVIEFLNFRGKKQNGELINFEKTFSSGINMIIADNLKGKSSVFKIIKTALVGNDDYIKQDIKQWIELIVLGFRINEKRYTISLNISSRTRGELYNCSFVDYLKKENMREQLIFEAHSNTEYENQMQNFFFSQFAYFTMGWTQKSSSKDSNELIESKSSWKTYFKTIYLESRDTGSFYGNQDQKTFQMLLSLEYTQLINRLTVKKELMQSNCAKQKGIIESFDNEDNSNNLQTDLNVVTEKLERIRNCKNSLQLIGLRKQRKGLSLEISKINNELFALYKQRKTTILEKEQKNQELNEFIAEYNRISNEICKTQRLINDIHEYLEVGQFFSPLEIKYCPSCNHQVVHSKTELKNTCPLCHEFVDSDNSNQEQDYLQKADELEKNIKNLVHEKGLLEEKKRNLNEKILNINKQLEDLQEKISILETNNKEEMLNEINQLIEEIQSQFDENEEKDLIAKQAVLIFQVDQKKNAELKISDVDKLNYIIEMLDEAIIEFDNLRYKKSQTIIDSLKTAMLKEIHDFGLTSITDIEIDKKFNITYIQNDVKVKFSEIAEGEQLRVKLAFYLSLIQLDIEKNHGRHTRFLILDSPNKEEGDTIYLEGLKEVLNQIEIKYQDQLQIIIGTATREFAGVVKNEKIYGRGEYLF